MGLGRQRTIVAGSRGGSGGEGSGHTHAWTRSHATLSLAVSLHEHSIHSELAQPIILFYSSFVLLVRSAPLLRDRFGCLRRAVDSFTWQF